MTQQEALEKMKELQQHWDAETSHEDADKLLCAVLTQLGWGDVADVFTKMDKWYA